MSSALTPLFPLFRSSPPSASRLPTRSPTPSTSSTTRRCRGTRSPTKSTRVRRRRGGEAKQRSVDIKQKEGRSQLTALPPSSPPPPSSGADLAAKRVYKKVEGALPKVNETEASAKIQAPVKALNATKAAVSQFVDNTFTWAKPVGLNKTVNSPLVRKLVNKTIINPVRDKRKGGGVWRGGAERHAPVRPGQTGAQQLPRRRPRLARRL